MEIDRYKWTWMDRHVKMGSVPTGHTMVLYVVLWSGASILTCVRDVLATI